MVRRQVPVAILLSLCLAPGLQAQGIGSAIKKKVTQAAKGNANTPAAAQQAPAQNGSRLGFQLTGPVLDAFKNGLDTEIAGRQAYLKSIANLKSEDEFQLCAGYTAASEEGMALQDEFSNRMDKVSTQADMQKVMKWMTDSMAVLTTKACGPDPTPKLKAKDDEFQKALDAGLAEFGKGFPGVKASDVRWNYNVLKEWILPFCGLSQQEQQNAAANGLSIHGSGGANVQFVYTADEAKLLMARCAALTPLIQAVE